MYSCIKNKLIILFINHLFYLFKKKNYDLD